MPSVDTGFWIYVVFLLALVGPFSDHIHFKGPAKILLIAGVAAIVLCACLHFVVAYAGIRGDAKLVLGWFLIVLQTGSLATAALGIVWPHVNKG